MKSLVDCDMVRVKICGITSLDDALYSIKNGAAVLGFNFYTKSPRYIDPEKAARIITLLSPFVLIAGVFVNEKIEYIKTIQRLCGLDMIQLHGDETPEYCGKLDQYKVIKAIRVKDDEDVRKIMRYNVHGILFDAFHPEQYGGTGARFQWELLKLVDAPMMNKVIVAGGITPDNITGLLEECSPAMIDVCSGVEQERGIKDRSKIKKLFRSVSDYNNKVIR